MFRKKVILSILFSTSTFFTLSTVADANAIKENVSVFYENEAGKKLILQKANDVDEQLNNIDAIIGDFSKEDIRVLEDSDNIKVVDSR